MFRARQGSLWLDLVSPSMGPPFRGHAPLLDHLLFSLAPLFVDRPGPFVLLLVCPLVAISYVSVFMFVHVCVCRAPGCLDHVCASLLPQAADGHRYSVSFRRAHSLAKVARLIAGAPPWHAFRREGRRASACRDACAHAESGPGAMAHDPVASSATCGELGPSALYPTCGRCLGLRPSFGGRLVVDERSCVLFGLITRSDSGLVRGLFGASRPAGQRNGPWDTMGLC